MLVQYGCTANPIAPYEAQYSTKIKGIKVKATRKLEHLGNRQYRVSWQAKALWMQLKEWAEFQIIDDGVLMPISYHYRRKGLGSDRPIDIIFDHSNKKIRTRKGDKEAILDLPPRAYDKLTYQVQLQLDLQQNPAAESLEYVVANSHRLKHYRFTRQGSEPMNSAVGPTNALIFQKSGDNGLTTLWVSPESQYLPVAIQQRDKNGDVTTAQLQSITLKAQAARADAPLQTGSVDAEIMTTTTAPADGDDDFSDEF